MKKIISLALSLLMLFTFANVSAEQNISVELDAIELEFDAPPINVNGRVLVPVRAIFEAMGAVVTWNEPTKTVVSKLDGKTVVMTVDDNCMLLNGEKIILDVPPQIVLNRTMVPARAAVEAFGAGVLWDGENNRVKIITKEYLSRKKNIKKYESSKVLSEKDNIKSNFSIDCFLDYEVKTDANDGTDFELLSISDKYLALLSIRADVYTGPEHPMTNEYAKSVAESMVRAVSGTLISTEISYLGNEEFIKIHYTIPGSAGDIPDDISDVLVYMSIENGVVYTMTYTRYGEVPKRVSADINEIINTFVIK